MHTLKNMKLTKKFVIFFLGIALIAAIIGIVGILGMSTLSREDEQMYLFNTKPMGEIAVMYDTLASQRICANNMVIFFTADSEFSKSEAESLTEKERLFDEAFKEYKKSLSNAEEESLYNAMEKLYYNDFKSIKQAVKTAVASGNTAAMATAIKSMDDMGAEISSYMDEAFALNNNLAAKKVEANKELSFQRSLILFLVILVGIILSILFAMLLSNSISKPLNRILAATKQVGQSGDLSFPEKVVAEIKADSIYRDELGQFALSFSVMMDALIEKTKVLETIAVGDLTPDVKLVSKQDTIGNALVKMVSRLNDMFGNINAAANQVASGSNEIALVSQALAEGATEQAAAVEQLSCSLNAIAAKTAENSTLADDAASLAQTIKGSAELGSEQMERMLQAVQEINDASQSINKVIQVIDDIAFQTNILALNAAVEAARAGEQGKGFAVVAEEVRNLAAKSAQAAQDTSGMIANSMEKAQLGAKIAEETSVSLSAIVNGINRSSQIVSEIAHASVEQNKAISQINNGVEQVAQVVQQNSSTAQESAAASEEMNGQAVLLNKLVTQFKLKS